MAEFWSALQIIAEERILEGQKQGIFDNLPGQGKPLPPDDMADVPQELRMAWRILKNAGCVPEEIAIRKEIEQLGDLLVACKDEKEYEAAITRLRLLVDRLPRSAKRHMALEAHDEYYQKVLARLVKG